MPNTELLRDPALRAVVERFAFPGAWTDAAPIKTGHINRTYRLSFEQADGGVRDYVLQRVNTYVFRRPVELMENVLMVTEHLRDAYLRAGEDPANRVLRVVPALDGTPSFVDAEGGFWRAYEFITGAYCVDHAGSPEVFREIGAGFGAFQRMLVDFPIGKLHDTIPFFHDTRRRLEAFEASVAKDALGRAASVAEEIDFVRAHIAGKCAIVDMLASGALPLRVTHNDTKINNVMLEEGTGRALCVIDLDTVMPGSVLYDFGEAIRTGASTADEDEPDLSKVRMDLELYAAYTDGFVSETIAGLTPAELENLPLGPLVMTFENGVRFLTDHLDGDVYFHIDHPGHNLDRARNQFRLVRDMEAKWVEMDRLTRAAIAKYR